MLRTTLGRLSLLSTHLKQQQPQLLHSRRLHSTMSSDLIDNCIFCKIIRGEIPSHKIVDNEYTYAFLDIHPLSEGHALVVPKFHAEFLHEVKDEFLSDLLPIVKKVALAIGAKNYNVLQNNGKLAHQAVPHVHFHIIPKPNEEQGLGISWPQLSPTQDELKAKALFIIEKFKSN